jgi:hypothetical protein
MLRHVAPASKELERARLATYGNGRLHVEHTAQLFVATRQGG